MNPRYREQSTMLRVGVPGTNDGATVEFEPTNSSRDVSFGTPTPSSAGDLTIALSAPGADAADALAVTSVEIRHAKYPRPADGAGGDAGRRGGSDAVLGHRHELDNQPPPRRLRVPAGAATGFLWALDELCGRGTRQWQRDQQYGHRPHQRRDVRLPGAGLGGGRRQGAE